MCVSVSVCSPQAEPSQLCFIAFLPNILDSQAQGRRAYLDAMAKLAADYKDR